MRGKGHILISPKKRTEDTVCLYCKKFDNLYCSKLKIYIDYNHVACRKFKKAKFWIDET